MKPLVPATRLVIEIDKGRDGGHHRRLRYVAVGVLLVLLAAVLSPSIFLSRDRWASLTEQLIRPDNRGSFLPPPTVQTFVAASLDGDEAALRQVTSPVYWLELRRQGVQTAQQRAAALPNTLTYVPIGGARDGSGYGHWLYTTLAPTPTGGRMLTIWRVDSDPSDRVLWAAPTLFLDNACDRVVLDTSSRSLALPNGGGKAMLVVSAHCPDSNQGIYVLQRAGALSLTLTSIQKDGETYPAAWLFGRVFEPDQAKIAQGYLRVDRLFKGPTENAYLAYLRDLGS